MRHMRWAIAGLALGVPVGATSATTAAPAAPTDGSAAFVTENDVLLAAATQSAVSQYCAATFLGDFDKEAALEEMQSAAGWGGNSLEEALVSANSFEELTQKLRDDWLYSRDDPRKFIPVAVSALLFCIWVVFAIEYCFKRCRCKARRRITPPWVKRIIVVAIMLLIAGIAYYGLYASLQGIVTTRTGVLNFFCTWKKSVSVLLNGQETEPTFPGTVQILRDLQDLHDSFEEGSDFQHAMANAIPLTAALHDASLLAHDTVGLLRSFNTGIAANPSKCPLCLEVEEKLYPVLTTVKESLGYTVGQIRHSFTEFTATERLKIQSEILATAQPLTDLKVESIKLADWWVTNNGFQLMQDAVNIASWGIMTLVLISMVMALALLGCGTAAACRLWLHEIKVENYEDGGEDTDPEDNILNDFMGIGTNESPNAPRNPFNRKVFIWARRTWCWGFFYAIFTFLMGGSMLAVLTPLAQTCLLLDNLDEDFAHEIKEALPPDFNPETVEKVVGGCLKTSSDAVVLADILKTKKSEGSQTFRETLKNDVQASVVAHYQVAEDLGENSPEPLVDDATVAELVALFKRSSATLDSQINSVSRFQCDLFNTSQGVCDPNKLSSAPVFREPSVCVENGTLTKKEQTCSNKAAFIAYFKAFEKRVPKVLVHLDQAAKEDLPTVQEAIEPVFDKYIDRPIDAISDKSTCNFVGALYQEALDGLCYQGMVGVKQVSRAYLVAGVQTTVLVFLTFVIWRIARDNYDHYLDQEDESQEEKAAALVQEE